MRRLIEIACKGEILVATLDEAPGTTGLLIVSGGNEIRSGAHRGMALLAAALAAAGHPVFRYDRRGIGDSTGENHGFRAARDDLIAAAAAFRAAAPNVTTIIGFGNCDAATTLALFGRDAALDRIILANPWTIDDQDDLPPTAAIRARYAARLRRPSEWRRLLSGGVNLSKLISGLKKISTQKPQPFAAQVIRAIDSWGDQASVILAKDDTTAIAYTAAATQQGLEANTLTIATDSHSFARAADKDSLAAAILTELRR